MPYTAHMQYNLLLGGAVTNESHIFKLCYLTSLIDNGNTCTWHHGKVHAFECVCVFDWLTWPFDCHAGFHKGRSWRNCDCGVWEQVSNAHRHAVTRIVFRDLSKRSIIRCLGTNRFYVRVDQAGSPSVRSSSRTSASRPRRVSSRRSTRTTRSR